MKHRNKKMLQRIAKLAIALCCLLSITFSSLPLTAFATTEPRVVRVGYYENEVFQEVDVMPEFPGGTSELMKFIENNFQFPIKLAEGVPTGRVVVQVVIQKDGTITDAKVTEGIEPLIDKEALRVISLMPKWEPGKIKGKVVYFKGSIIYIIIVFSVEERIDSHGSDI